MGRDSSPQSVPLPSAKSVDKFESPSTQHFDTHRQDLEKLLGGSVLEPGASKILMRYSSKPLSFIFAGLSYVSLIFPRGLKPSHDPKCRNLHSTAWLDALRGYASWVVCNHHVVYDDWRPGTSFLGSLPWFKFIFRGSPMVDVFFVISGYALSYRMVGFMHSGQPDRVMDSLASSTFRRYLRLYLPTATATFIAMLAFYTGLADKLDQPSVVQPTLWGNIQFWIKDTVEVIDPFRHIQGWWYPEIFCSRYLIQMWTIPIEFRGSMILFLFCAAVCKMAPRKRMIVTWTCVVASLWWQAHYVGLFLVGMWIADSRLWNASQTGTDATPLQSLPVTLPKRSTSSGDEVSQGATHARPLSSATSPTKNPSLRCQMPYLIMFFASFIFLTGPEWIDTTSPFPFNLLGYLVPPNYDPGALMHFPMFFGAIMLVYSIDMSPLLQRPLMTPFSQWLGELSFGVYAMHHTVRWAIWERWLLKRQDEFWGDKAKEFFPVLPVYFTFMVAVFWAAELFRIIDVRFVKLGKILQEWCFEK